MEFLISIVPFLLIFVLMYFMMIRPQQKQAKKTQSMLDSLQKGDSVVTIGGLHGVIDEVNVDAKTIVLDCEGIYLTFERRAIARVVQKGTAATSADMGTNQPDTTDAE